VSDIIHTVAKGETVSSITKKYGITLSKFKAFNPQIKNVNKISIGQKVKVGEQIVEVVEIFNENDYYFVEKGDTINEIAEFYDISIDEIKRLNPEIADINKIFVGQLIKIAENSDYEVLVYQDEYTPIAQMDLAVKMADGSFKFNLKNFSDEDLSSKFYEIHALKNATKTLLQSGYLDKLAQTMALKVSADTPILLTLQIHDKWIIQEVSMSEVA